MYCSHNAITRLVATLSRRTHVYFERRLRQQGLNFTQTRMLSFLAEHPGSRQEDLRAHVDMDKGGVAHAVRRLVELGYVHRKLDPGDGRVRLLDLTPAAGRSWTTSRKSSKRGTRRSSPTFPPRSRHQRNDCCSGWPTTPRHCSMRAVR